MYVYSHFGPSASMRLVHLMKNWKILKRTSVLFYGWFENAEICRKKVHGIYGDLWCFHEIWNVLNGGSLQLLRDYMQYMWKMNGVVVVRNMCQVECKTFNTNVWPKTDFPTKGGNTLLYTVTVYYTHKSTPQIQLLLFILFFFCFFPPFAVYFSSFSSLFSFLSHNFTWTQIYIMYLELIY